jgi:short-subunit dehydrogenase
MAETEEQTNEVSESKVAVITGASSGIGRATAIEFAQNGYHVVLAARRQHELQAVAEECEQYSIRPVIVTADTTSDEDVQKIAETALLAFGHFDIWVNNAGVYLTAKFEDSPIADIKRLMDVNFYGYVYGSRVALTQFKEQGYGTLINVSSINASAPQPYISVYSASKAAIRALDEAIRMELRIDGLQDTIHVCTVMPASIDTNLFQNSANYTGHEVQAIEPVYDARYAAKQIVSLAMRPRREIVVGLVGRLMRQQNAHMPRMYEKLFARFTNNDLLAESSAENSSGNLYEPIETNTGISGGWREKRLRADKMNMTIGTAVATVAGLIGTAYVLMKRRGA